MLIGENLQALDTGETKIKSFLLQNRIALYYVPIIVLYTELAGFPGGSNGKESACNVGLIPGLETSLGLIPGFNSRVGKIPWRREWLLTPAFLPGEFHG